MHFMFVCICICVCFLCIFFKFWFISLFLFACLFSTEKEKGGMGGDVDIIWEDVREGDCDQNMLYKNSFQ